MRQTFRQHLLGVALLAPAVTAPSLTAAQTAICRADAAPCCRSPVRHTSVKPTAPSFGVHIWPATLTQAYAIERLVAMRPRHLRFALGPNWRHQPALHAEMTDLQLDASIAAAFAERNLPIEISVLQNLQQKTQAKLHLVIWEPPPLPLEAHKREPGSAGRRLQSPDVAISARFLVAVLKHIAAHGLQLDAVELSNEPDGGWNIRIEPTDYLALVKEVKKQAKRRAVLLPKIYGPATSSLAALRNYLRDPKIGQTILDNIDVLSVHGWDNPRRRDRFLELDALFEDLKRLGRRPELALTEYGLARPEPADSSDRMNVKMRTPDNVANTSFFGSLSARDLLRFYAKGVGTIIHWEFRDESWGKASFGLLDEKSNERPIYQMMRTISQHLASDWPKRIDPTTVDNLFVAYRPGRKVLWSSNPTDRAMAVVFANGTRPVGRLATGLLPCRGKKGAVGFTAPPWSLISTLIQIP